MNKSTTQKNKKRGGFVLVVAVLIASLLLAVGLAVINLSLKGFSLVTTGRDSQFAFYAADAGAECALYWDLKFDAFATSSQQSIHCNSDTNNPDNQNIIVGGADSLPESLAPFTIFFLPDKYCALVTVKKEIVSGQIKTTIEARGYNTYGTNDSGFKVCNPAFVTSSERRLERAVRVSY